MSHALWKSSPAICTNGSLQMFFQEVISPGGNKGTTILRNRKYLKTLGHLSMKTCGAEPLSSDAGTVPGTVDDSTLKQIRLPMLKTGFHQKGWVPSPLWSTNSIPQCEASAWPCSHAPRWWSKLITLVPLLNPASV